MGNIESFLFMNIINEYEIILKNNESNLIKTKKQNNIINCHICNKNLSNKTIYRGNDLSFCSIEHRNLYYKLN
jgi:hypothetical protein